MCKPITQSAPLISASSTLSVDPFKFYTFSCSICIFYCCINIIAFTPKLSISIFVFQFTKLFLQLLFPFKYLIKLNTLIFGDISINLRTSIGYTSTSALFTLFHSHNFLNILLSFFGNKTLLLYTLVQIQYDIYNSILTISIGHTHIRTFHYFFAVGRPQFHYSEKEFLLLLQNQKAFLNHASNTWFSLYKRRFL